MKKFSLFLVAVLLLSVCAMLFSCGPIGGNTNTNPNTPSVTTTEKIEKKSPSTTVEPKEPGQLPGKDVKTDDWGAIGK